MGVGGADLLARGPPFMCTIMAPDGDFGVWAKTEGGGGLSIKAGTEGGEGVGS